MEKRIHDNWGSVIFLTTFHLLLLIILPFYFYFYTPSAGIIISSIVLLYLTGLSITGGYHRYFSHRSYKTGSAVEAVLLFFGGMAIQGSALRWAFDHRLHHAHVDGENDPYSIARGFWYAHCLWILDKPREVEPKVVPDLIKNKLVMFQDRYYKTWMLVTNALAFLVVGWLFDDYVGALVLAVMLRLFALQHFTWFINSLAHTWGEKPFCQELSAVDNYFLSVLTFGEGYHNYHHTFANDYRNGVRWFHFDPTKWLIWTLNKVGLAHSLKRVDPITIEKRMVIESKNMLLEKLTEMCHTKKEELEILIHDLSEQIVTKIAQFNKLKDEYLETKRQKASKDAVKAMRQELKIVKKSLRHDWHEWLKLTKGIMTLSALPA